MSNRGLFTHFLALIAGGLIGVTLESSLRSGAGLNGERSPAPNIVVPADTEQPPERFQQGVASVRIYKGQTATVPAWQWVDIEAIRGKRPGKFDAVCGIEPGGTVTAIGTLTEDHAANGKRFRVLVSYDPPDPGDTGGTPCDGGEAFYLDVTDFQTMTARYEKAQKSEKLRREVTDALLER